MGGDCGEWGWVKYVNRRAAEERVGRANWTQGERKRKVRRKTNIYGVCNIVV